MLWILVSEACTSIFSQRLRTSLAMTGIMIGISSVVLMIAIGDGSKAVVEEKVRQLGTNVLIVTPSSRQFRGAMRLDFNSLSSEDVEPLNQVRGVVNVSPSSNPLSFTIARDRQSQQGIVYGAFPSIFAISNWSFASGTGFNDDDVKRGQRVLVIGNTIKEQLFGQESAPGRMVKIENIPYQVIGVLKPKGQSLSGGDQDNVAYAPITTVRAKLWKFGHYMSVVQSLYIQVDSQDHIPRIIEEVTRTLRETHHLRPGAPNNFNVRTLASLVNTAKETDRALSLLIGGIASISLLVGGIGIMNIMLVTVTERTREIGIRKAIGATFWNILVQFLLEAVMIAASGSFAGLVAGLIGGIVAMRWFAIPVAFTFTPVLMALVVAVVVGIISGLYPAYKAARLQPIEALRSLGG